MGLLAYLLFFWLLVWVYHRYIQSKRVRQVRRLKMIYNHVYDRLRWDDDVLTVKQKDRYAALAGQIAVVVERLAGKRLKALPGSAAAGDASLADEADGLGDATATDAAAGKGAGAKSGGRGAKVVARDPLTVPPTDDMAALQAWEERLMANLDRVRPVVPWQTGKEFLEMVVVVLGVVMGARALFIQPFKIPTGSMQPTLYGVHFTPTETAETPSLPGQLLHLVNDGRRYADVKATAGGRLNLNDIRPARGFPVVSWLLPSSQITTVDDRGTVNGTYILPGEPQEVYKYLEGTFYEYGHIRRDLRDLPTVEPGGPLARGYLDMGDHLFVDRVSFNFREPRRGDIVVFVTDDITYNDKPLSGRYFIKRLVGLPGETLQIRDRKLYVKAAGATEFRQVDGSDSPAFDRIYSMQGGYRGYSNPESATHLRDASMTFELKADQYFMMGDNTENSQDSRYWGVVSRDAIVGRALSVWWPFSRRWGRVDLVEPLPVPSVMNRNDVSFRGDLSSPDLSPAMPTTIQDAAPITGETPSHVPGVDLP